MAKTLTNYSCTDCGARSPVALGRCPRCGTWGSMQAMSEGKQGSKKQERLLQGLELEPLSAISEQQLARQASGIAEIDRVLGGGWVAGAVVLLSGEPGIGKSTLLLQLANYAAEHQDVLYVAGEESLAQVKMRAQRLAIGDNSKRDIVMTRETNAQVLAEHISSSKPSFCIVDSIQTLLADGEGTPGSISQVRDASALLSRAAKEVGSTLVLIGHITKQGSVAGPKVIEHMVDATMSIESASGYRVLRSIKNRFGAAGEVAVFEMTANGMQSVDNPSEAFLAERPKGVPGSVIVASLEGQRPLLLEVQALAAKSPYAQPRRTVQGLDSRRVDVVLAVLERRLELPLAGLDIYVNVAGGLRLTDPGVDLAIALAVYSAVTNRPVPEGTVVTGEIGLAGELRRVPQLGRRVQEVAKAKFQRFIGPPLDEAFQTPSITSLNFNRLAEALNAAFP